MARGSTRGRLGPLAGLVAACWLLAFAGAPAAQAAGNASAAAGFLEGAQNKDGGFGARQKRSSNPTATLWASLGLLAAGKNPRDEFLKNGKSAEQYMVAHRDRYSSLRDLALLTLVQSTARLGASRFGNPAAKLRGKLDPGSLRHSPDAAALGAFGLLATRDPADRALAQRTARTLLGQRTSDGAWGPDGNADSASTALVLQALAKTGVANSGSAEVKTGLDYLHRAQSNDGSIASSTRVDKAAYGGSVAATAFTVQAFDALRVPQLRTPTGKTPRQGLVQYQQESSGGLTSKGSQYSPVPPSVTETAQAYPAFAGRTFPLPAVTARTKGPAALKRTGKKGSDDSSDRVSGGTAEQGVAGDDSGDADDPGAFSGGTAGGNGRRGNAAGGSGKAPPKAAGGAGAGEVSGQVVGTGPKLKTKAGASDTGLTPQQRSALWLGAVLALMFALGALVERQPPRDQGSAVAASKALGLPLLRGAAGVSGVAALRRGERLTPRRRWPLAALVAVGAVLIAVPFATHMFDRAPQGERMVDAFEPYMTSERIDRFKAELAQVGAYADELKAHRELTANKAQATIFLAQWGSVRETFDDLLARMEANRDNYEAVRALPRFGLFPWAFLIPGVLLAALGLAGLAFGVTWLPVRRAALALGVLLVLAPLALQLYSRAPAGQEMIASFARIENRAAVQKVQGDFGTITVGRGAVDAELIPALRADGLSARQIKRELPAAVRLNDGWIRILNDMTPMIGVMSDNVGSYRAAAALPRFSLFPWLFLVPGLLAIGFVLLAGGRPPFRSSDKRSIDEPRTHTRDPRDRGPGRGPGRRRPGSGRDAKGHVQA